MRKLQCFEEISFLDWPGWGVENNAFGNEFDKEARKRMIVGGKKLLPTLEEYSNCFGSKLLEIGPFFNPLTEHLSLSNTEVTYWENDANVCSWLKTKSKGKVILCDVNNIENFKSSETYNTIILSQIINYLNFDFFLRYLTKYIETSGLVFINNVVNYGIPNFFSRERPISIEHTIQLMRKNNFELIEKKILEKPRTKDDYRLIGVFRYLR